MRTEPIEAYRGILIYEDRHRATNAVTRYRANVNGKQVDGATLDVVRRAIDREHGPRP